MRTKESGTGSICGTLVRLVTFFVRLTRVTRVVVAGFLVVVCPALVVAVFVLEAAAVLVPVLVPVFAADLAVWEDLLEVLLWVVLHTAVPVVFLAVVVPLVPVVVFLAVVVLVPEVFVPEVFGDVDLLVVVFLAVEDLDVVDFDVDVFLVVEVPFLVAGAEVEVSASVSSGSVT